MTPFIAMQKAVDIVGNSPHPANKVAATLFGKGYDGQDYAISQTNKWPEIIDQKLGRDVRIGNASGTIHAETACIVNAPYTDGASLCITDPFCPNCAKNIAEAGIKTIYIDHKGFKKDFFARRSDQFETMSMQICEKAGITVYELWRKDEKLSPIYSAPEHYTPPNDSPITVDRYTDIHEPVFQKAIAQAHAIHNRRKFALAAVKRPDGYYAILTARAHAVVGFTHNDPQDILQMERTDGKYSFIQEPMNRMIMHIRRYGYTLFGDYLYCSQVPTAREQVNMVGADIKRISIGNLNQCRDPNGLIAMDQLKNAGILQFV